MTHPNEALFDSGNSLPIIPTCEHFAGSEKFILKAMSLQEKMGPIFFAPKFTDLRLELRLLAPKNFFLNVSHV